MLPSTSNSLVSAGDRNSASKCHRSLKDMEQNFGWSVPKLAMCDLQPYLGNKSEIEPKKSREARSFKFVQSIEGP